MTRLLLAAAFAAALSVTAFAQEEPIKIGFISTFSGPSGGLGQELLDGIKLGLRVDFDRYIGGQKFLGMKSFVLDNHWQDGSFMHERLAMAFFACRPLVTK